MFKQTKKALLLSVLMLVVCLSMLIGTTYAWFTDSASSGSNVITTGNLDIAVEYTLDGENWKELDGAKDLFQKDLWEPGHTEVVALRITNKGTLALKYKALLNILGETTGKTKDGKDIKLSELLTVTKVCHEVNIVGDILLDLVFNGGNNVDKGSIVAFNQSKVLEENRELFPNNAHYLIITVDMPETIGNEANHDGVNIPAIKFSIDVIAAQYNSESDSFGNDYDKDAEYPTMVDTWNGTVDISWFLENPTATEYTLDSAEDLAGLAALVDGTAPIPADSEITLPGDFEGVTFKLGADVDLYIEGANGEPVTFDPIGDKEAFTGTFDGQGHTISNLYQSGWALGYEWGKYGSIGLFGNVENATIKNLTISGAESFVEGGDVAGITGSATGTCVFENITIENSKIATYNNGNGGIIGWSGAGHYTFKNITIAEDVVLAGLWGSFDSSIGGIVGQAEPGATYIFENVDVACRIDAYNDCTASYDYYNYRMCGMLIGRLEETTTIDGVNYPDVTKYNILCTNVTVTYGEWVDYHYCEPTPAGLNGGRGMRVEPGYQYGGLPEDYDHSQCVDNCRNLIVFDQIFGGDQIAVKGLKAYDGVDVIYNNDRK